VRSCDGDDFHHISFLLSFKRRHKSKLVKVKSPRSLPNSDPIMAEPARIETTIEKTACLITVEGTGWRANLLDYVESLRRRLGAR